MEKKIKKSDETTYIALGIAFVIIAGMLTWYVKALNASAFSDVNKI